MPKDQEYLETLLKGIVDQPEKVKVDRTVDELGVLLTVKLGDGDAGLVIGKAGKTIIAIRTLMASVGARERAKINIKLDVPDKAPAATTPPRNPSDLEL